MPAQASTTPRRRPPQARLVVGAVHDPLEREADLMADRVMGILSGSGARPSRIRRMTGRVPAVAEAAARTGIGVGGGELDPALSSRIQSTSGAVPLGAEVRERMERGFGADFSGVRIHAGSPLPAMIAADAFTLGSRIHFAPGRYDPSTTDGQRLLSHELTHVVQQGAATARRHTVDRRGEVAEPVSGALADDISLADAGSAVRRHSAWEHMLIGDLDPDALAAVGATYDIAGTNARVDIGDDANGNPIMVGKREVKHVIRQEINRLTKFQDSPPTVDSFEKVFDIELTEKRIDPTWDVTLVGVPNNSGTTFLVTYGELNTLGDYFGSIEELKAMDPVWVDKLIRGVRQSTMRRLVTLYAEVTGLEDDSKRERDGKTKEAKARDKLGLASDEFKSADGKADAVELGGKLNELKLMGIVPSSFAKPAVGGEKSTSYASTLARNACHFAPECWHAWAGYHERARDLADKAYKKANEAHSMLADINDPSYHGSPKQQARDIERINETTAAAYELRNDALLENGFGDHYLQDSYAAGHLINKTRIMQMYVRWLDKHPEKWDAHRDKNWRKLQQIAYNQPGLTDSGQYVKANIGQPRQTSGGIAIETARNPQTVENLKGGGWKAKAEALGLQVPASIRDPNAKVLLLEWQTRCVNQARVRTPRVQTFKAILQMGRTRGISDADARAAVDALFGDGIIRKESYKTSDLRQHHLWKPGDMLTLRDEYVPSGKASLARATAGPGAFEDMTLGVAYNDYLDFMNSAFLQKATNFLHDHWCKEGLEVQGDDGAPVFRVYGDENMFKRGASKGLRHSGETAHRSRDAIISIADTGTTADTTQAILQRLPSKVQVDPNNLVGLDTWRSDRLMDALGTSLFERMSDARNVLFNKLAVGAKPGRKGAGLLGTISKDPRPSGHDVF
jgi:hypothetical protein